MTDKSNCFKDMRAICVLVASMGATLVPNAEAQQLSPQDVFKLVSPSVVVIEVKETPKGQPARVVASGSGVVIPSRGKDENLIATNCHLTDKSAVGVFLVRQGASSGVGFIYGKDPDRDLCLIQALFPDNDASHGSELAFKKLPAVRIASSQWLEVGDPVYALGAPEGLELTLSDGLVSGIRQAQGTDYIQTTAPISKGSSGGGLFDAQGRLVGITTMYLKDGQALNFAVPAELIASVPRIRSEEAEAADAATAAQAAADAAAAAADAAATTADIEMQEPTKPKSRWLIAYQDKDLVISFDTQTVTQEEKNITVWSRTRFSKPRREASGKLYVEEVSHDTFYCGARKSSYDEFTWRNDSGDVVFSRQLKSWEIEKRSVMPDTVGETVYIAACGAE